MYRSDDGAPIPPFRPAPGLGNPHLQTLVGRALRPDLDIALRRERLETPDGDFLDIDFAGGTNDPGPGAPLVVVLHGLEGMTTRKYMRTTYRALLDRGIRPVGMNFRGCSGEPNRTARAYHSGETGDLRFLLERLKARHDGPFGVMGYSLGGNVTLKFLGESEEDARTLVSAGAAVSVPFDLDAGGRRLEGTFMGRAVYTRYFMKPLRRKMLAKGDLVADRCDLDAVARSRSIRDFDDAATAPIFGFESAADYYARSSSDQFIPGIRVPTLIVHSRDDPFLPEESIPEAAIRANPAITPVITDRGGHQGYLAGSVLHPVFWVEEIAAHWLAERLKAA
jgi:predicted alpha/beta-fold hydrolase